MLVTFHLASHSAAPGYLGLSVQCRQQFSVITIIALNAELTTY